MHSFVVLYDKLFLVYKVKVDNVLLWEYSDDRNGDDIYEKRIVSWLTKYNRKASLGL